MPDPRHIESTLVAPGVWWFSITLSWMNGLMLSCFLCLCFHVFAPMEIMQDNALKATPPSTGVAKHIFSCPAWRPISAALIHTEIGNYRELPSRKRVQCLAHLLIPCHVHVTCLQLNEEVDGEIRNSTIEYWILCLFLRGSQLRNLAHGFEQHGLRPPHRYPTAPVFP